MKKIYSIILVAVSLIQMSALPVSAGTLPEIEIYRMVESDTSEYGYIDYKFVDEKGEEISFGDNNLEIQKVEENLYYAPFIPSSYDLRDYGYVSSVKYQGSTGNCWAFACMGSLESNSIMQGNSDFSETDFSETHLVWFAKNSKSTDINDPNYDEGKTVENPYTGSDAGGNTNYVIAALSRWSGLAKEKDYPFYPFRSDALSTIGNYDESVRYDKGSGVVLKSAEDLVDEAEIKQWIMENGAVTATYYSDTNYYNKTTYAYNYPTSKTGNHMIAIVGWDDDYSVDNFLADYAPQNNGAWLCKNSWSSNYWGLDGYFWMSYEDANIKDFVGFTTQKADDFTNNYTYNAMEYRSTTTAGNLPSVANVFRARDYEVVSDVATYTMQPNMNLTISIYKDLIEDYVNPTEGTLVASWQTTLERSGYHTIDVPLDVFLEPGTIFSVVIQMQNDTEKPIIVCEGSSSGYTSNAGESFISNGTKWFDTKKIAFTNNVYVQALTKCVSEHATQVYMNFRDNLIITPSNEFEQLKEKTGIFSNSIYSVKDINKKDITYLTTGSTLTVTQNNGETFDFTIVVEGDVNGDGVCDVLDASETELIGNGHKNSDILQCYAANGCVAESIDVSAYQNVVNLALAN